MEKFNNDNTFLARWLNGKLTPEELKEFENTEDYESFLKIVKQSSKFEFPVFDQLDTGQKINELINKSNKKVKRITKIKMLSYISAIAAVVMLVFTLVTVNFNSATTTINSSIGQHKNITLPDGSEVLLNGNSRIAFKNEEWKNLNRILSLEGEGLFTVKKGSTFTVVTEQGSVEVVGTQFNVKSLPDFYSIKCYEGKVRVKENDNKSVLLTPGEEVYFNKNVMHFLNFTDTSPSWINNNYEYNEVPLAVVLNDLQNVYKISSLETVKLDQDLMFTGKLVVDDLNKALDIICKSMNLDCKLSSNKIEFLSK